jgi:hypothetical protein
MKNSAARKLKQVPAGYLIIGIDAQKTKHAAVAIWGTGCVAVMYARMSAPGTRKQILETSAPLSTLPGMASPFWIRSDCPFPSYSRCLRARSATTSKGRLQSASAI